MITLQKACRDINNRADAPLGEVQFLWVEFLGTSFVLCFTHKEKFESLTKVLTTTSEEEPLRNCCTWGGCPLFTPETE